MNLVFVTVDFVKLMYAMEALNLNRSRMNRLSASRSLRNVGRQRERWWTS